MKICVKEGQIGYILGRCPVVVLYNYPHKGAIVQYLRCPQNAPFVPIGHILLRKAVWDHPLQKRFQATSNEEKIAFKFYQQYCHPDPIKPLTYLP
jgi:hypothetical protein